MKSQLILKLLLLIGISSTLAYGACFLTASLEPGAYDSNGVRTNISSNPRNEADYSLEATKVYHTKSCYRAKKALKKYLKNRAKNICRANGSPRTNLLRCTKYYKSCTKYRNSSGQWRTRVTGTFEGACR